MDETPAVDDPRRALAARLRELRLSGFGQPLNRKELGRFLGQDVMRRPQGAYGERRIGDFENPSAPSPPPPEVLRAYAHLFGRRSRPPSDGAPSREEEQAIGALERELLALRAIDPTQPPPRSGRIRRWLPAGVALAVLIVVVIVAVVVGDGDGEAPPQVFCARNLENHPSSGSVAIVCARDVRLRRTPDEPAEAAIASVQSGDRFVIERYTPSGTWVRGAARLKDGREIDGWLQAGWFCPVDGSDSPATACGATRR